MLFIKTLVFFETPFTFLIAFLYKKEPFLINFCLISLIKSYNNILKKIGFVLTKNEIIFLDMCFHYFVVLKNKHIFFLYLKQGGVGSRLACFLNCVRCLEKNY